MNMQRAFFTLLVILEILMGLHCVGSDALFDPPGGRGFWARRNNLSTGEFSFYRIAAMHAGASNHAEIYTEVGQTVSKNVIDGMLAAFENTIVPITQLNLAKPTDVDTNGKVILLLLDIQDGYPTQNAFIGGYFDPFNEYKEESVNALNSSYHSNQADMLYLDTNPWLRNAEANNNLTPYYATLAHEYTHLLQFSNYYRGLKEEFEPTWINEGLAEVTADLVGFGPQTGRANNFRRALLEGTSLIKDTASFGLANYAHSYMYFRYLADVYGISVISTMFNNPLSGVPGINASIKQIDAQLLSNCGNTSALEYPHFTCSYRFLWGSMLNANLGDSPAGVQVVFNGVASTPLAVSGLYSYKLNPQTTAYQNELVDTLLNGSFLASLTPDTGPLESYAVKLYKNNQISPEPSFSICSACRLTMVSGTKYFAVFNHDVSTTTPASGRVADSIVAPLARGFISGTPDAQIVTQSVLPPEEGEAQKLEWHISIPKELHEFLKP
ncbi:MAG: hypothetical protein LDLANPLL_02932 [Turneriella sp.]|nr:hypothetical protein [Turneriella sp.]